MSKESVVLPFEPGEYLARVAATKRRMEEAGIEVLLVSDPCNMNYLTGYDATSYYVHQMVAVALEAEEPLWIGRQMDVACARFTTFLHAENLRGYPESYIGVADRHPMAFVAKTLVEQEWDGRRIGVEMDAHFFSARCYQELVVGLPAAQFSDASLLVNWVRIVKSPQEIVYMRQAGEIVEKAMNVAVAMIEPGVRQCDVAAAVYEAAVSGTAEFGGDMPEGPWMPAGARTSAPHLTWTDEPYRAGEATNLELNACRHRYTAALARTVMLGQPPAEMARMIPVVIEGLEVALDRARAGGSGHEVEAAWRGAASAHGIEKSSRIGYSIGIGYPGPSWNERTASLQRDNGAILSVGRAATVMPIALLPTKSEAKKRGKRKKRCCKANCAGKTCGDDGCGGVCGFVCQESEPGKICCEGLCKYPNGTPSCCIPSGELCTPDGGVTFGSYVCCSKSCDTGAGHTNLCD